MNPAELLAMATTRAVQWQRAPTHYGRIKPEDVLHALGLVHHTGASLLLRVKYCGQEQFARDLDRLFWMAVVDISTREKWPYPKKLRGEEFYRNLGRMALAENISPGICPWCGGPGKTPTPDGKIIDCDGCRGTGRTRYSLAIRAEIVGMARETYRDTWHDRYRDIQSIADRWESLGLGAIRKRLRA